jgi:hypothetical protein
MSRPAQKVRHGVFAPLEVREKREKRGKSSLPLPLELRDKREKRGKPSLPVTFPRFSRSISGAVTLVLNLAWRRWMWSRRLDS